MAATALGQVKGQLLDSILEKLAPGSNVVRVGAGLVACTLANNAYENRHHLYFVTTDAIVGLVAYLRDAGVGFILNTRPLRDILPQELPLPIHLLLTDVADEKLLMRTAIGGYVGFTNLSDEEIKPFITATFAQSARWEFIGREGPLSVWKCL